MIKYHQELRLIPSHLGVVEYNSLLSKIENNNLTINNNLIHLRQSELKLISIGN